MNHHCTSNVRIRATHPTGRIATNVEKSVRVGIGTAQTSAGGEYDGDLSNLEDFSDIADQHLWGHRTGTTAIVDVVGSSVIGTAEDSSIASIVQSRWLQQSLVFSGYTATHRTFGKEGSPIQVKL